MTRTTLIALLIALVTTCPGLRADDSRPRVYIIPIHGMIEPALHYVVRRGVDEAARADADAIILAMDTPGGRVDAALDIVHTLELSTIPLYTFVEGEAISAGALIALCTPSIHMRPGSVIGDITPISLGLTGGVQELPAAEKEKMTSYVAAHVRAAAEQGGYDPQLAEAMVRADLEYRDGETIIIPAGHVLTMTNTEAERRIGEDQHPLLSRGTVQDLDALLDTIGLKNAELKTIKPTGAEQIARIIAGIAPLLLIIGIGGLWLEIKTPGFGIFGITGISCLLLFFVGHHIAGLAGMEELILFTAGVALLLVEVFITPGFGIMGFSGLALIFVSLTTALLERIPGRMTPPSFAPEALAAPLATVIFSFFGSAALVLLIGRFLPKTPFAHALTLGTVLARPTEPTELLGCEGIARSDLRPSGIADFAGRKLDVVSHGGFIAHGTPVRIAEVHGNRIVVEPISPT